MGMKSLTGAELQMIYGSLQCTADAAQNELDNKKMNIIERDKVLRNLGLCDSAMEKIRAALSELGIEPVSVHN